MKPVPFVKPGVLGAVTEGGPSLRGAPFRNQSISLTDTQRQQVLRVAIKEETPPRGFVYREKSLATDVFICGSGCAKSYRELPGGARHVVGFLFAKDLFGLAEKGLYVNSVQAITPLVTYRIPIDTMAELMKRDPDLELKVMCKIAHELRVAQRKGIILARNDAVGRVVMFFQLLNDGQAPANGQRIPLPMSRADIADYLALSGESVSRATTKLIRRGVVAFEGRRVVRVVDHAQFEKIIQMA
jgi:CRP-like cAMP-binding protein